MGAKAYRLAALYAPGPGIVVEVGSEHGEGSTKWLAAWAGRCGLPFYTADVDPEVYARAREITPGAQLSTGAELLQGRRWTPIVFAYLDGFDYVPPGTESRRFIATQRGRYQTLGLELGNEQCWQAHLEEAVALGSRAGPRCLVIVDDTWPEGREWQGKGRLAVPQLESDGFKVVFAVPGVGEQLGAVVLLR